MSDETQALCFLAGANSIFYGDKLLTTENPGEHHDRGLFEQLGIQRGAATCDGVRLRQRHAPRLVVEPRAQLMHPPQCRRVLPRSARSAALVRPRQPHVRRGCGRAARDPQATARAARHRAAAAAARPRSRRRHRPREPRAASAAIRQRRSSRSTSSLRMLRRGARQQTLAAPLCTASAPMRSDCRCRTPVVDLVFSNLMLEWCHDPDAVFAEVRARAAAAGTVHVHDARPGHLERVARALARHRCLHACASFHRHARPRRCADARGFRRAGHGHRAPDSHVPDLARCSPELRGSGSRNVAQGRPRGLTGRARGVGRAVAKRRARSGTAALPSASKSSTAMRGVGERNRGARAAKSGFRSTLCATRRKS